MENRINEILEKLKRAYVNFFKGKEKSVSEAEQFFRGPIEQATTELLSAYYEEEDRKIRENKPVLRELGLTVVRRNEKRDVLTTMGPVRYARTYYRDKEGKYLYPVDLISGVKAYQRLSNGVCEGLVETACSVSYAKSTQAVVNGSVSCQSVMRKIRAASVPDTEETNEKPRPCFLHVDADEAHVTLCGGKNTIVPMVSVYEGIEKRGKRGICKNVFHISAYGKETGEFWDEILAEIEKRYDLSRTTIYLHGDGAQWIQAGLEYLPNAVFVLDSYHKNKALSQSVRGLDKKTARTYRKQLTAALKDGQKKRFDTLADKIRNIQTRDDAEKALSYLSNHFQAIHIRFVDSEARNGGATEPHISHILASRLSSRPMAWSEKTLIRFVPILAAGRFSLGQSNALPTPASARRLSTMRKQKTAPCSLGLPDPDQAVSLPACSGKVTPLSHALRSFCSPT